jgi:hypothetical protein
MSRRAAALLLALLGAAGLVAGCTGVPTSSAPKAIEQVNVGPPATAEAIRPKPDEFPLQIVQDYLRANSIEPGQHLSAQSFLTTAAKSRWSDLTASILRERVVSTFHAANSTITVSGRLYGTLDRDGVFESGDGTQVSFVFKLARVNGQYRIAQISPAPGLLLTTDEFQQYGRHVLYFFDNDNRYLVPDPRWTDIGGPADPATDRTALAKWLLNGLVDGPRANLSKAVSSDTFPAQVNPGTGLNVVVKAVTQVEIPGSSQLDPGGRVRLAAQLSQTLDEATSGNGMEITDGGKPVPVAAGGAAVFQSSDFTRFLAPDSPSPDVYYLSGRSVLNDAGKPISGPLGRGAYPITSLALSRPDPVGPLLVAAVEGTGAAARLDVGTQGSGLRPLNVTGVTSRPSLAGARHEAWVGAGTKLFRVTLSAGGVADRVDSVPMTQPPGGTLRAVRVSPDGARIALVFATGEHNGQLYVGAIVRGSGPPRIGALDQVNPRGTTVADVGWLSPLRLFAIGHIGSSLDSYSFDSDIDGTDWQNHLVGLADTPNAVTVTPGGTAAWVSAGGFVWKQDGTEWKPPTGGQTPGTAPTYLE